MITQDGISVLPITSLGLNHKASSERISTGVSELDEMFEGKGYYRGSTILVSGTAGTGKSSLTAAFVNAACQRGERCIYFAFEESMDQILRNMRSIGIDLAPHVKNGLLQFQVARPTVYGLEMHLVTLYEAVRQFKPQVVVLDPITDFFSVGSIVEVKAAVTRIIDFLKMHQITAMFSSLTSEADGSNESVVGVSSLIDTWIGLRNLENNGERQRGLFVLKSRGMAHSREIRSYELTSEGIKLRALDLAGWRSESGMA